MHANLQSNLGQRFNNAFSDLLSFLRIDVLLRRFFEAFANRIRNYRNHLMLINQLLRLRAAQIVLHNCRAPSQSTAAVQLVKMKWPDRLGRAAPFNT